MALPAEGGVSGYRGRAQPRKPAPKPKTSVGGGLEKLLALMTAARGAGAGAGGAATQDYAAQAAANARAADVAHQRELAYTAQQQDYQMRLAEWQARRNEEQAELQRRYEVAEREKALEHERQLGISGLLSERQERYAQMLPSDAIRATLFALGLGQGTEPFRTRAGQLRTTLAPLAGAEETARGQESALSRLLGGRGVRIGEYGVQGLGSAQQAARAWAGGGADVQSLLASAFGLGSTYAGEAPGIGQARLQELVGEVTPRGMYDY